MISIYLTDGHGNVRMLADADGNITDTYDYDAFGNLINQTGNTENDYLYCGEQYDSTTGYYYLRARYMDTQNGRFINRDYYEGNIYEPAALHKYTYVHNNPVMGYDPTGLVIWYFARGTLAHRFIENIYWSEHPNKPNVYKTVYTGIEHKRGQIDIYDPTTKEIYEIKPDTQLAAGKEQLSRYLDGLKNENKLDFIAGTSWPIPDRLYQWPYEGTISFGLKAPGLIYYTIVDDNRKSYTAIDLLNELNSLENTTAQRLLSVENGRQAIGSFMMLGTSILMLRLGVAISTSTMTGTLA